MKGEFCLSRFCVAVNYDDVVFRHVERFGMKRSCNTDQDVTTSSGWDGWIFSKSFLCGGELLRRCFFYMLNGSE